MSSEAEPPSTSPAPAPSSEGAVQPPGGDTILPATHWTQQAVQDDGDGDSSIGDDAVSSTASLSESIWAYRTVHGRTFHSDKVTDSQYWTPNDEKQMQASDIIHHLLTLVHDGELFKAPLQPETLKVRYDLP